METEKKNSAEPDIESCIGKLSAIRNEVLEMNMMCDFMDFMDSPCDAYTFKHRLKKCMKLLESLEDDIFICESLIGSNNEEE